MILANIFPWIVFPLILAWLVLATAFSIVYRRRHGLPIFRPSFDHALFLETWRSGYSRDNFLLQFGGARNCLWVVVSDGRLQVSPHFPFNLFGASHLKLEFSVPGHAIKAVEKVDHFRGNARVIFERTPGVEEQFELMLNAPSKFVAAVEAIRQTAITAPERNESRA